MKNIKRINKCSKRLSIWDENQSKFVAIGAEDGIGGRFCGYEDELTLDETFDRGIIMFKESRQDKPIKPFTPVRIEFAENDGVRNDETYSPTKEGYVATEYWLSSVSDVVQDTIFTDRPNTYTHRALLAEPTFLLTQSICDTLTFTNKLGHNVYDPNAKPVLPIESWESASSFYELKNKNNYYGPINAVGSVYIEIASFEYVISLKTPPGVLDSYSQKETGVEVVLNNKIISQKSGTIRVPIELDENILIIRYKTKFSHYRFRSDPSAGGIVLGDWLVKDKPITFEYKINIFKSKNIYTSKPYYTISEVIRRILEVGVVRQKSEPIRYKIKQEILEKYENVRAPEFHITRNTLFEALLQVGHYVHAIPRLLWNEEDNAFNLITFDELGCDEEWKPSECDILTGKRCTLNAEEYYGAFDSVVSNMINTTNEAEASVQDLLKTTRTEEGSWLIENDTATITTDFPIYQVLELKAKSFVNGWEVDLTPYLYEAAEYQTLSSFDTLYPSSKCYALTYKQGDCKINGLSFIRKSSITEMSPARDAALTNILYEKIGISKDEIGPYRDIAFSVKYIPIVSARIVQKKAYKGNYDLNNSLIYNQQENTLESTLYGEHVKGVLAMIGNELEFLKYKVYDFNNWPKCGQKINGKYIFDIRRNILSNDSIEFNMILTENFNKLNGYYGVQSNFRLFDVSEKQSINREINYGNNILLSTQNKQRTNNFPLKNVGAMVKDTLLGFKGTNNLCVIAQGFSNIIDEKGSKEVGQAIQNPIKKGLITGSMGNSIFFNYKYVDNYSAGEKAEIYEQNKEYKYSQKLVPYGDVYGELYYLKLHILKNKDSDNLDEAKNAPECEYDFTNTNNVVFDYATDPLVIRKDSRECLNVTTQINFVAEDKEIVIGRLLCLRNSLVNMNANYPTPKLVLLPYKVNMLNSYLDLTNATSLGELNEEDFEKENNVVIGIKPKIDPEDKIDPEGTYKSWAIVDTATGEYYLAVNNDKGILNDGGIKAVYFNY